MAGRDFVNIIEVGPRDGLQSITETVPTTTKIQLIEKLSKTGLHNIEATSFVSPKWVPQLSDATEVMRAIAPLIKQETIAYPVLVPNIQGLEAAFQTGAKEISVFVSASEGFSRKNINCTVLESIARARVVVKKALQRNFRVRAWAISLSTP